MADFVLIEGDQAEFLPNFEAAVVVVKPGDLQGSGPATLNGKKMAVVVVKFGDLQGSGPATLNGKKMCVDGDEKNLQVPDCAYTTPEYSTPGTGTLKIAALAGNQKATKTCTGGKAVLLKGDNFTASFEVQSPAQPAPPDPPISDATPQYSGSGRFITTNTKFQGA